MTDYSYDEVEDISQLKWEYDEDYQCMSGACDFTTHDPSELKACINCGRTYCPGCLSEIGFEPYCADCVKCHKCHAEATYYCERGCGKLLCPDHVYEVESRCDATGYHDVELTCGDCKY